LKHQYQLVQEANEILQILSVTILEKMPVFELFSEVRWQSAQDESPNQLSLFV